MIGIKIDDVVIDGLFGVQNISNLLQHLVGADRVWIAKLLVIVAAVAVFSDVYQLVRAAEQVDFQTVLVISYLSTSGVVMLVTIFACADMVTYSDNSGYSNPFRNHGLSLMLRLTLLLLTILAIEHHTFHFIGEAWEVASISNWLFVAILTMTGAFYFLACEKAPPKVSWKPWSA